MVPPPDERQPLLSEPLKLAAVVAAGFGSVSGLMLGYDVGITNGVLLPLAIHFDLSPNQKQLFAGILNAMAVPGCMLGGYVADCCGRRGAIGIGSAVFLFGNAIMTMAYSYEMLVFGRALTGLAVGLTLVTNPLYTAETSPARLRGMLTTNVEVSYNVGIVVSFFVSWAMADWSDATKWRWMLGLCMVVPVVSLIGVFAVVSESPRWLASRGRLTEAEAVLRQLLGPQEAQASLDAMSRKSCSEADQEIVWCEMVTSKKTRWLMFLGSGIAFFSQASGIDCVMYYSSMLLTDEVGLGEKKALLAMVVMGLLKLVTIFVQGGMVDAIGRRPLLILSGVGMSMSMFSLGVGFALSFWWFEKVVSIIVFVGCFSLGIGPIVYTLNAELYPRRCRTKGMTLAMGVARAMSAINTLTFMSLSSLLTTGGAFFFYGTLCAALAVFVALFVPETSGRSLEDDEVVDKFLTA